jgi:hypothetical protein
MALMDYIENVVPAWMRQTPFAHWLDYAFTIAAGLDAMIDGVLDAAKSDMPGQTDLPGGYSEFASVDALPLIGRDRRIEQGLLESPGEYAGRLRRYQELWRRSGTPLAMLEQLAGILSPNAPRLRIVTASGVWYTREEDGTFRMQNSSGTGFALAPDGTITAETGHAHPWDWDSLSPGALGQNDPGRLWVIIYCPCNAPYLAATEGHFGDGESHWGDFQRVIGTSQTSPHVELVRKVLRDWRAAGIYVSHILYAFDPSSFDPLTPGPYPAAGMPDGHWGHHSKFATVAGVLTRVPSRLQTARYGRGTAGLGLN